MKKQGCRPVQGEDKVFTLNDLATARAKSVAAADD